MREVCYRGRCTGEDDYWGWQEGFYVCLRDSYRNRESHRIYSGFAEADCGNFYGDWYEVDPETVGQFTGLLDKNGNRIYEGDIVIRQFSTDVPMLVEYDDEAAQFIVKYTMCGEHYENTLCGHMYLEVIGNIYDNPELMK